MHKYEALETMLEKILEHDTDIETALAEYPDYAEELRPLLQSAIDASAIAVPPASADVVRRGRTRLLQHAAQMRDTAPKPRGSFFDFRFAAVTLALLLVFFIGGTGIVQASESALPGDSLYPVKLGWESTHYWFADNDKIASLEAKHEEERREEVQELLGRGRLAAVRFEGVVIDLNGSKWEVAGVPVIVSKETDVEDRIQIGSDVIVSGQIQPDGAVLAEKIILSGHSEDHEEIPTERPAEPSVEASGTEEVDEPEVTVTPEPDGEEEDEIEATETPDADDGDDEDEDESEDEDEDEDEDESEDEDEDESEDEDKSDDEGEDSNEDTEQDDDEGGDEDDSDGDENDDEPGGGDDDNDSEDSDDGEEDDD